MSGRNAWPETVSPTAFGCDAGYNKDGPGGVGSTDRGLTRSSSRREGVSSMLEDPQTPRDPHAHTHNPTCAHCPMCGSQAIHDVTRLVRGVYLANYTDGTHIWDTRWLAAA